MDVNSQTIAKPTTNSWLKPPKTGFVSLMTPFVSRLIRLAGNTVVLPNLHVSSFDCNIVHLDHSVSVNGFSGPSCIYLVYIYRNLSRKTQLKFK